MLLTRIARAHRFAAAMTNDADRKAFSVAATELEGELLRCQGGPLGILSGNNPDPVNGGGAMPHDESAFKKKPELDLSK